MFIKPYISFAIAYTIVMVILVYLLRLPQWITQNHDLVQEYYFTNKLKSFFTDLLFITLYWLFAYVIWTVLKVTSIQGQIGILVGSTILLTTVCWFYFTRQPYDFGHFFNRWFHTVGLRSVVYDALLLGILFMVYQAIKAFLPL